MEDTKIEWAHHTWNPWIGCTKVSDGCKYCYAEVLAKGRMQLKVWGPTASRQPRVASAWAEPLKWNTKAQTEGQRKRVFCASLADVFEGPETCQNPDAYVVIEAGRAKLWETIAQTPWLDWLLLTKRPENILRHAPLQWTESGWPANVWAGTTVENQDAADTRIPELLKVPAAVRFLSVEPMVGAVDLNPPCCCCSWRGPYQPADVVYSGDGTPFCAECESECTYDNWLDPVECNGGGINWVICGGESGTDARPMCPAWARQLRDQCVAAGVPFLFKQWGEYGPSHFLSGGTKFSVPCGSGNSVMERFGKKLAGRTLDGRTWDEYPELAAK